MLAPITGVAARTISRILHRNSVPPVAHNAATGYEPETSMYYPDALAAFGADSRHLIAACQGQAGAGLHYLRTVAGGHFRDAR